MGLLCWVRLCALSWGSRKLWLLGRIQRQERAAVE